MLKMSGATPPVSPKREAFDKAFPSRSGSITSGTGNSTSPPASRSNSVSRRASLPAPRVSIGEKPAALGASITGGPISAAVAAAAAPSISPSTSRSNSVSSRRASVATGMLSVPFQKTTKEAPRWRPTSYMAQVSKAEGVSLGSKEEMERLSAEESVKPLQQKIFEKTAVSLALGLFVVLVAFLLGSIARVIIRRDLGILGLWINQLVLIAIFVNDKRPEGGKRMDKFTPFEVGTLICQVLPMMYTLVLGDPSSYYGLIVMIIIQSVLKFGLMHALGEVVEISL